MICKKCRQKLIKFKGKWFHSRAVINGVATKEYVYGDIVGYDLQLNCFEKS
jgi:hypothetical protein